ncbi:ABC transporter ATP-binding protein [Clostridium baratii]|uniref:ABC transporter ATP-binding protein n=1 Tax=Clostridium baratii TaxID=1561 RepID=UPI0006BAED1D|nr:oligopeptide/dipeptide ABC transporter ATP-binding protein [Clostridium baratii]
MKEKEVVLEVKNLCKFFQAKRKLFGDPSYVKAVDDVSFTINKGETLGLVGESGCGKTTTGRTILKLYNPTSGQIIFNGQDITKLNEKEMIPLRRKMQMIFQDPYASLNPRMTVGDIIGEAIDIHGLYKGKEREDRIRYLLDKVGLNGSHINRYAHEFSGGQRQRIGIARALAVEPDFIVCDEPISALDVSIQAQVINMLEELQEELGLTYLFIAHDLSMVKHISTHIGVMYLGKMVEKGPSDEVYLNSKHPYTKALLSAVPIPDPDLAKSNKRIVLEGDIPSPIDPKPGCRFKGRCKYAKEICGNVDPEVKEVEPGHFVACHLY